jgi:hypothetical protein
MKFKNLFKNKVMTLIKYFDPVNNIIRQSPKEEVKRGEFMNNGLGVDLTFSIRLRNKGEITPIRVEIFNPVHSILKNPNDSQYNKTSEALGTSNLPARPIEITRLLKLIGSIELAILSQSNYADFKNEYGALVTAGNNTPPCALINPTNGDLVYLQETNVNFYAQNPFDAANSSPAIKAFIHCSQVFYSSLLQDLETIVLDVRGIRMQVMTIKQFSNPIEIVRKKTFGGEDSITIDPSEFQDPLSPSSKNIDIMKNFFIDKSTGLFLTLEGDEDVLLTFFVKAYKDNGVSFN